MAVELATAYISLAPSASGITAKLEKELGGLDKVANDIGEKSGSSYGGKFMEVAGAGMIAGVAVIGAALTKGLLDAIDTEAAGQKLNAQLGASGAYAEDLGEISGKLFANAYGENIGEVNEAIKGVLQQGLLPEDATNAQIEGITEKVLDLSSAFDQDVAGATSAVSQLMRTGLVDSADEAFDVITRGFQQGADAQGDYLDTLREYGTQFRNLGLDAGDATGLISQGLKAGARDSDIVADALKEFGIRAIDGSKLTAEGFAAIGLSADEMAGEIAAGGPRASAALDKTMDRLREMTDPAERARTAVALFGTQAEDMGEALYALDPSEAVKTLGTVEGAATEMGDTLNDTAASRIESFKRKALGGLSTFMADNVLPGLETLGEIAGEKLPPLIDDMSDAFDRAGDALEPFVTWLAVTAGPALADVFTHISDSVRDAFAFIDSNSAAIQEAVGHVVNVLEWLWATFGDRIMAFVTVAWNYIRDTIESVINVIKNIITLVLAVINGDWGKAWDAIKEIVTSVWSYMTGTIDLALAFIKAIIGIAWDAIRAAALWAWDGIKELIGKAWDWIWEKITGVIETIKTGVSTGFEKLKELITTPIDGAKTLISDLFDDIRDLFTGLPDKLKDALGKLGETVAKPFEVMGDLIAKAWNDTIGGFGFDIPDLPGIPGGGTRIDIPEMHRGGPVGGRSGQEVLRILEAGEWVLSRDQVNRMRSTGVAPSMAGVGAGAPMIGNLAVTTVADATADEVVDAINAKLGWVHTTRRDR